MTRGEELVRAARDVEIKALADPSRRAVFQALHHAQRPLLVRELASDVELHHNAVRAHLAVLAHAGLVSREALLGEGRGRPAHCYSLTARAQELCSTIDPNEELALMLLEVILGDADPREIGRRAGQRLRTQLTWVPEPTTADGALAALAAELGFEPEVGEDGIRLHRCPYAVTASRAPTIVCQIHLGLAEAAVAAVDPGRRVALEIHDPYAGRCRFTVHPTDARAG